MPSGRQPKPSECPVGFAASSSIRPHRSRFHLLRRPLGKGLKNPTALRPPLQRLLPAPSSQACGLGIAPWARVIWWRPRSRSALRCSHLWNRYSLRLISRQRLSYIRLGNPELSGNSRRCDTSLERGANYVHLIARQRDFGNLRHSDISCFDTRSYLRVLDAVAPSDHITLPRLVPGTAAPFAFVWAS